MRDRTVLTVTGTDRVDFLQGLITNDVTQAEGGIIYAALLTPQGKYLADFFVIGQADALLIDVPTPLAAGLLQRLNMYRLRADVQIATSDLIVSRGLTSPPATALADPRSPAMGWRLYGETDVSEQVDWTAARVAAGVPAAQTELTPESYILEMGFERLHGVDFRKGCFVGQEIVARMKHKTTLRKGLALVGLDGTAEPGTAITADGKPTGTLHSVAGDRALAYLRFDRAEGALAAGDAKLTLITRDFAN